MTTFTPEKTIQQQFEAFHAANPHIYRELLSRVRQLKKAGVEKFGIALPYEAMRYDNIISNGSADFKMPNNFRSRYARLIIEKHPTFAGVLRVAELRTR